MRMDDKLKLIQQYEGLINKKVNECVGVLAKLNDIDKDDLKSEIILYMLKKMDTMDLDGNIPSYMQKIVNTGCATYLTNRGRIKRKINFDCDSLDRKVNTEEDANSLGDLISNDYNLESDIVEKLFIKEIFDYVKENKSHNAYMMFKLYFIDCMTCREIGDLMGISRQSVNQVINRIIRELRAKFRLAYN